MDIRAHGTGAARGFTVLELLVTVTIAAILLASGVPALQQFAQRQQLRAVLNALHNDLLLARGEAVYRNATVLACPGEPDDGCAGSNDWSAGWVIFEDPDRDGRREGDEALLRHGQGDPRVRITGSAGRTELRFFPDGSTPGSNGRIGFCGGTGPAGARQLVISNIGRIRRADYPDIDPGLCP